MLLAGAPDESVVQACLPQAVTALAAATAGAGNALCVHTCIRSEKEAYEGVLKHKIVHTSFHAQCG